MQAAAACRCPGGQAETDLLYIQYNLIIRQEISFQAIYKLRPGSAVFDIVWKSVPYYYTTVLP